LGVILLLSRWLPKVPAVLVALGDTISTACTFAERHGQRLDGNKEMVGIGVASISAGLFQGFPVSTSGSRTAVAESSGSRTQLTGLVGAVVIAAMLLALPGLFAALPQPTRAAVVIAAALTLADVPATRVEDRRSCPSSRVNETTPRPRARPAERTCSPGSSNRPPTRTPHDQLDADHLHNVASSAFAIVLRVARHAGL